GCATTRNRARTKRCWRARWAGASPPWRGRCRHDPGPLARAAAAGAGRVPRGLVHWRPARAGRPAGVRVAAAAAGRRRAARRALLWFGQGVMLAGSEPARRALALGEVALALAIVYAACLPGIRARRAAKMERNGR